MKITDFIHPKIEIVRPEKNVMEVTPPIKFMNPKTVVNGAVVNTDGELISGATFQFFDNVTGEHLTQIINIANGYYEAWTEDRDKVSVLFRAEGYNDSLIGFNALVASPDVILSKGGTIAPWMIGLVGAAVIILWQKKKNAGKKVGKIESKDVMVIFLIVGGVLAFGVIKKILNSLGLTDSADTIDLDDAATNPNSFWNPNYWQTIKPSDKSWTHAVTENEAKQWVDEIYESVGMFNDCEECVIGIFKRCRTRANVSFMAWVFNKYYNQDLLTWLRGGYWPQDRLSDSDVNIINQYVNSLPKY